MGTILTTVKLAKILAISESLAGRWMPSIDAAMTKYEINTKLRISAFVAQIGHESSRLSVVSENLNYSAAGLLATFPSYFNSALAEQYARQPERIANRAYASRLGNGNEASGDGWKYRGRGLIQVTGMENYRACSKSLNIDLLSNPEALIEDANAAMSAGWFWGSKGLNNYADRKEFDTVTKRINSAMKGKAERDSLYQRALKVLDDEDADTETDKAATVEPDKTGTISKEPTPIAKTTSFGEPAYTGGKSSYPNNRVYESTSGHIVEFDDTPGNERIHVYHRSGTYQQIDPTGNLTVKSILDHTELTKGDKKQSTEGDETINISGQSYKNSEGDMVMKTGGDMTLESPSRVQANTPLLSFDEELNGPTAQFTDTTTTTLQATTAQMATATAGVLTAGVALVGVLMIGIGAGATSFGDSMDISGQEIQMKKPVNNQQAVTNTGTTKTKEAATFEKRLTVNDCNFYAFKDVDRADAPTLCYWDTQSTKWRRVKDDTEFVGAPAMGSEGPTTPTTPPDVP